MRGTRDGGQASPTSSRPAKDESARKRRTRTGMAQAHRSCRAMYEDRIWCPGNMSNCPRCWYAEKCAKVALREMREAEEAADE